MTPKPSGPLPHHVARYAYQHKLNVRREINGHYKIIDPRTCEVLEWTTSFQMPTERAAIQMCDRYLRYGPRTDKGFRGLIRKLIRH